MVRMLRRQHQLSAPFELKMNLSRHEWYPKFRGSSIVNILDKVGTIGVVHMFMSLLIFSFKNFFFFFFFTVNRVLDGHLYSYNYVKLHLF